MTAVATAAIRPAQLSASASGAAPGFVVNVDGAQSFDIELTIDPVLLNGANQNRRRDANYYRTPRQPGAPAASVAYTMPDAVWLRFRLSSGMFSTARWSAMKKASNLPCSSFCA